MSDWNQHCAVIRRELTALEKDGHLVEGPVAVAHGDMELDLYELEKGFADIEFMHRRTQTDLLS